GTVVPFLEQTIYPRVTGWLSHLVVYAGDRVRKGQVLAELEAPDLTLQAVRAAQSAEAAASEVPAAVAEAGRARAEQRVAEAELSAAETELASSQAELEAAKLGVEQAQAEVAQARASLRQTEAAVQQADAAVEEARKALASAQAEFEYWKAEIQRAEKLVRAGAISQDEYQMERSKYESAFASVQAAQAKVGGMEAAARAARASVSEREAVLDAAVRKLGQMRSAVAAAEARVRQKRALVAAAKQRVDAAKAGERSALGRATAQKAMAASAGEERRIAETFDRYRIIRAPMDGVVLERLVHPGTLVAPGVGILRMADGSRVRVQAYVAEKDMQGIRVGSPVLIRPREGSRLVRSRVSSIFPQADPTARTFVVEAVVSASSGLKLGEYVVMEITTWQSRDALTVPTKAITSFNEEGRPAVWVAVGEHSKASGSKKLVYFCTMHPEVEMDHPGNCPKCGMKLEPKEKGGPKRAHQVYVVLGRSSGTRTEVLSGISEGDEVIVAGYQSLREGDSVTPVAWGPNGPKSMPKASMPQETGETGHQDHSMHQGH
ncbi:MAG: efflux RND transporter periplasmic adaptor subunit, partial [Armatimonadota bacterium]